MQTKIVSLKPIKAEIKEAKISIDWDDGGYIKELVVKSLRKLGLYKDGLGYAAYGAEKLKALQTTGLAFPEFSEELYATFLDETGQGFVSHGASSYIREQFSIESKAVLAVYDLEQHIDLNDEPSNLKPVNKNKPLNGLIAIITLSLED